MPKFPLRFTIARVAEAVAFTSLGLFIATILNTNIPILRNQLISSPDHLCASCISTEPNLNASLASISPNRSAHAVINASVYGTLWQSSPFRKFSSFTRVQRGHNSLDSRAALPRLSFRLCRRWAVVTTVFAPCPLLNQLRNWTDWCVVVVGNRKTNYAEWISFVAESVNIVYLSPGSQGAKGFAIEPNLSWDHVARKNIGYLFAVRHGATVIWDTEEYTKLRNPKELARLAELSADPKNLLPIADDGHHLWNPYPHFEPIRLKSARQQRISWPRGFPLEYIRDPSTSAANFTDRISVKRVGIFQSLVNGNPDVDGVYRLTKELPVSFLKEDERLVLPCGRMAPFNSRATLWTQEAFWGMFLAVGVPGQVSDIWRSFFVQRLMQDVGLRVAFTSPIVERLNEQRVAGDLGSEAGLYTASNLLTKWLLQWKPKSGNITLSSRIEQLAIDLYEIGVLEEKDVVAQQIWLDDLEAIGYVMPSVKAKAVSRVSLKNGVRDAEISSGVGNVAVCVSGQVRTLDMGVDDPFHPNEWLGMQSNMSSPNMTVAESIQRNLFSKLGNPDVFMSVSTNEKEREPKVGDLSVCEPLRPKGGDLFCEVVKEKHIGIHNWDMWKEFLLYKISDKQEGMILVNGFLQQLKGMLDCYTMMKRHSVRSGKRYDWVVRMRPDNYMVSFPSLEKLATASKEPTIWYGSFRVCCCGNEDRFGIGRAEWMERYFDRFLYLQQTDWGYTKSFNAEGFLETILQLNGIKLKQHAEIKMCTVKPTYRTQRSQA